MTATTGGALDLQHAPIGAGDRKTVELWLHGHAPETQRKYLATAVDFFSAAPFAIGKVRLADLQQYRDALELRGYSPNGVRLRLNVVKSLFSFAHRIGAIGLNPGAALRLPPPRPTLADRILSETDVLRLIDRAGRDRDRTLLRTLYAAALRATEATHLRKRDVIPHAKAGVLNVLGKGARGRVIRVSAPTFGELVRIIPGDADPDDRVFPIGPRQLERIVHAAAARAGLPAGVSPHWLRHAHASHALDRGCPIHLVQQTLGHRSVQTTGAYLHARPSDSSALYLPV